MIHQRRNCHGKRRRNCRQRFYLQAVVALIECLDPENDWDHIKNEPKTKEDKVDNMLYKDGSPKSAIQVKPVINAFELADVKKWF